MRELVVSVASVLWACGTKVKSHAVESDFAR